MERICVNLEGLKEAWTAHPTLYFGNFINFRRIQLRTLLLMTKGGEAIKEHLEMDTGVEEGVA